MGRLTGLSGTALRLHFSVLFGVHVLTVIQFLTANPYASGDRSGAEPDWERVSRLWCAQPPVLTAVAAAIPFGAFYRAILAPDRNRNYGISDVMRVCVRAFAGAVCGVPLFWCVFVLFGAPVTLGMSGAVWGLLLSFHSAIPLCVRFGARFNSAVRFVVAAPPPGSDRYTHRVLMDRFMWWVGWSAVAGSMIGCFVLALDWDRSWQSWPVPSIIGCAIATLIASTLFTVLNTVNSGIVHIAGGGTPDDFHTADSDSDG